jgi:double-stranded uracil-DNA glycosylase
VNTLPDRKCREGGVVLVGINPATASVAVGHYYQGRLGQRIWARLRDAGLLDTSASRWEDDAFVAAGNGLTDLVKRPTASASELTTSDLADGRTSLADRINSWRPGLILFVFRPSAEALMGRQVRPGLGGEFAGIRTFLMEGPYAAADLVAANIRELRSVSATVRRRG